MRRRVSASWTVAGSLLLCAAAACDQPVPAEEHVVKPAEPSAPAAPEPAKAVDPSVLPKGVDVLAADGAKARPEPAPQAAEKAESPKEPLVPVPPATPAKASAEKAAVAPKTKPEPAPAPKQEPAAKTEPATPQPAKPEPEPEPAAKPGVKVPRTEHVRVDVPKGMQALLDADTRMQPWADKAMAIVERCYVSKGFGATATLVGVVTMHQNERPDVDVTSLPPTLAAVVACATGDLMRNRMPLFTGPEGQRHTLKVRFTP